jgi:anthranilate phosphoribosyltransferase
MAVNFPTHSSVTPMIDQYTDFGDQVQEEAFQSFYDLLQGDPTPGEVAAGVAKLGISLETAAKIMSAAGKTKDFIEKVYDAARM